MNLMNETAEGYGHYKVDTDPDALTALALAHYSAALLREAKSRRYAGAAYYQFRAVRRAQAVICARLAKEAMSR